MHLDYSVYIVSTLPLHVLSVPSASDRSLQLETSFSGPVPDPFDSFPLDLTAILSLTVSGIPGL